MVNCKACQAFHNFFATSSINSILQEQNVRFYLSSDINILNETSKPPLNIFSNILTYMIHKWLQFTHNLEKNQLNLTCQNFIFMN